ncbi:hypothetical protein FRC12_009659 [Ceratobasidium sp. 428]|nr:hypothetical protein FRC12_009659 [Ceratobasidium sp. 428]
MSDISASRVFYTPELLGIICGYCTTEDLSRLIPTSKYTFKVAAPRIWNDLKSVRPLLSLLSPTIAIKEDPNESLDIALPVYSVEAFARFDLYCPLVRSLDVSDSWGKDKLVIFGLSVSSWECLGNRASLLPNLQELTLSKSYTFDEEILLWFLAFVSPGLQDLTVLSTYGLAQSSMIIALDLLQDRCPRLKQLVIPSDISASRTIQAVNSPMALRRLRGLQSLTILQVHSCFIDSESLIIVSSLPKLERFYIVNNSPYYNGLLEILRFTQLPDDSFPVLIAFHVVSDWLDIMMSNIPGVLPTELPIMVRIRCLSKRGHTSLAPQAPALDYLTFVLARFKPRLWPMYLSQMPLDWEQAPRTISEDPNWEHLRRFHLIHLGILNSSLDPPFMQASFPALPILKFLDMPDQFLTLDQLAYVSQQMPSLFVLRSNFADVLEEVPQIQYPSTAPLGTFKLVQPLKNRLEIRFPDQVARFLLSLWPKLQRLDYENVSREAQPGLELLNTHLQATREDRRNQKE